MPAMPANANPGLRERLRRASRQVFFVKNGESPEDAMNALCSSLRPGDFIGYDVETNALHPSDPRDAVTSMQVASTTVAVLLDPADPLHRAAMRALLLDERWRLTAHNASFDILRLVRVGVFESVREGWDRTTDTFILAVFLSGRNGKFGNAALDLKSLTVAWCGEDATSADAKDALRKVQSEMGTKGVGSGSWHAYRNVTVGVDGTVTGNPTEGNTWAQIPRDNPEFIDYCAADAFDSAHLAAAMDPIARSLWGERVEAEHRIARIVTEMTHRGVRLDVARTRRQLCEAHETKSRARAELTTKGVVFEAAKTTGNVSPTEDSVAEAIRAEDVEVPSKRRKNGKVTPVLDKRALKKYAAAGSTVAGLYRTWTKANKEITTHYVHYLRTCGDRVHAEITANEAVTGRMASRSPNLQNVPEPVKPCFIADRGMVFISADFSSIEMRVAAALTQDQELLNMYCTPLPANATERQVRERDPYWLIAWDVWGADATTDDRKLAKIICLAAMYGGGPDTIAEQVDEDLDLVKQVLQANKRKFRQLDAWFRANITPQIMDGRPFWTLPSGRFQSIDPTRAWAGFNLAVQGLARDLLLGAMFRLEAAGFGPHMLLPIHDEVLFQVPADRAEIAKSRIEQVMPTVFAGVPIDVEVKILGPAWVEKTHAPNLSTGDVASGAS